MTDDEVRACRGTTSPAAGIPDAHVPILIAWREAVPVAHEQISDG
jgi:hypothetical protein